jgi:hypothetical protein
LEDQFKKDLMKKINIFLIFCFVLLISSCSKSVDNNQWQAVISENKVNSLPEIFSQLKTEKVVEILSSKDTIKASQQNKILANQIASYFQSKYKIDITQEFKNNPEGIVILGIFYANKEAIEAKSKNKSFSINSYQTNSEDMECLMTAVGTVIGISQAKDIWKSIMAGATEATILNTVKLLARRVAAAWTLVALVYEVGGCLDFW